MEAKQRIIDWLEAHKGEFQQLLTDFIRILSTTGEEYQMQMAVKDYAEKAGFAVDTRAFDEQQRPCVLVTYPGKGDGKCLMLDAHSDTVPVQPEEAWEHDPYAGDFDGTWIHGRGATDDKWGIAASLMALRALKECGVELKGDVKLLSSVGEEAGADSRKDLGAGAMVRTMEKKPDFCIVCEESGKQIGTESPGNIKFTLHVTGKAVHACVRRNCVFPQRDGILSGSAMGVDALQKAMIVLDAIYRLEQDLSVNHRRGGLIGTGGAPDGPRNSIGAVSITPVEIKGGGGNALIPSVSVRYTMHYATTYTREEMVSALEATVRGAAMTDLWLREHPPVLEYHIFCDGFRCDPEHPAIKAMQQAHETVQHTPGVVNSWVAGCDADAMPDIPCAVYGPTGIGCHAANERSKLQELLDAAKVFALTAMDFCQ